MTKTFDRADVPRQYRTAAIRAVAITGMLAAGLSACNKQPVQCTAASAQSPVVDIVKEQLERSVGKSMRQGKGGHIASLSKIRAAIAQLTFAIEDIRTSKEDPNSTKRFCTGTLRIHFPADVLSDADRARQTANLNSVSDLADDDNVERHADSFTTTIEFNVQPTDDGSRVFAETESGTNMFQFAAEILSSSLMRASVEDAQRERQQATDQAAAEQNAALGEQRNANLASVRTDNQLATQTINAVWKALSSDTRAQLLPLQRAWIRKKTADCAVEAAAASTDPAEKEVARLGCDTKATQERSSFLQGYRGQEQPAPDDSMMSNESAE